MEDRRKEFTIGCFYNTMTGTSKQFTLFLYFTNNEHKKKEKEKKTVSAKDRISTFTLI